MNELEKLAGLSGMGADTPPPMIKKKLRAVFIF